MARTALALAALLCGAALGLAPPARAAEPTLVSFTETAATTLPRDQLQASLAVEASDTDPARLQETINRRMAAALARAKPVHGVTVRSEGYGIYQGGSAGPPWQGRQGLHLESTDQAALLKLVGVLQADGLVLVQLTAQPTQAAERAAEAALAEEALRQVKPHAERLAAALGLRFERLRSVQVGAGTRIFGAPLAMRGLAMSAAVPPPALAAGDAPVSVTVAVEAELAPAQ